MDNIKGSDGGLRELALFAGAGGGILGGHLLGWRTVCAVEYEPYAAGVLIARQNDGILPPFPIWDDVRTFDGKPWRGIVDVVSGGFPCQDISSAGKGAGIDGERSGLWGEMARIIGEVRPRYAFIENSPMLTIRGLDRVLCDLAALGYDAEWDVIGAHHVSAPHKRARIWILAHAERPEWGTQLCACDGLAGVHGVPQREEGPSGLRARGQILALATSERCGETGIDRSSQPAQRATGCGTDVADTQLQGLERHAGYGTDRHEPGRINTNPDGSVSTGGILYPSVTGFQVRPAGAIRESRQNQESKRSDWWATEPDVGGEADGVAGRMDLRAPHKPC